MNTTQRVMKHFFCKNLEQGISKGVLHLTLPDGEKHTFGGREPGAVADWNIKDWSVIKALISRGDIGLGETYTQGLWETSHLETLYIVFIDNIDELDRLANGSAFSRFWFRLLNNIIRRNSVKGSIGNISAHYDVGNDFYKLWLDPTMTYSSALFGADGVSLEQAQKNKYQRIVDRISDARSNVLEVGCGWGGFAEHAANNGKRVTGVTVSKQQYEFAKKRLPESKADIRLQDYRHVQGKFDAIASIEMFEAVGMQYWPTYFAKLKECLAEDGVAMVQTIAVQDAAFEGYAKHGDYIRHYVFPGGMLPSLAVFKKTAENAGLVAKDVYAFGKDYARTLREWLARFDAHESAIRQMGHGTEFIRSWRLYLSMCAASFQCGQSNVMQVELAHAA